MKRNMTILCSLAFMISGIMMAITAATDISPGTQTGYKTIAAANVVPKFTTPFVVNSKNANLDLSEDLVRDLARQKGVLDTVYINKTDTVRITKVKKVPVPSSVIEVNVPARRDTIQVPVYYLATQVGNEEGPTGECISVYKVHKVDEICTNDSLPPVVEK